MKRAISLFAAVLLFVFTGPASGEITLHLPGYSAVPFSTAPAGGDSLAVDGNGLLYAPDSSGITRWDSLANAASWSPAAGFSLAIAGDGRGYLATRSVGHSILRIEQDGSLATLVSSDSGLDWTSLAVGPSGELLANVWAGAGQGLYLIDTASGSHSMLIQGGPGIEGAGFYSGMTFGADGKLYTIGYDGKQDGLFRLDGGSFIRVATLPHAGSGLAVDSSGVFYTATTFADFDEVWRIDPGANKTELLASGFDNPSGIAFDARTARLFIRDQGAPFQVTAISIPERPIPALAVAPSAPSMDGTPRLLLSVTGLDPAVNYIVVRSADMSHWAPIGFSPATVDRRSFTIDVPAAAPRQFFKVTGEPR